MSQSENGKLPRRISWLNQMSGVPVASMAIGGSHNAAIFALEILATADDELRSRLHDYKKGLAEKVLAKDKKVQEQL